MLLFFLPPVVQAAIGVVVAVVGLALLHSYVIAAVGVIGVGVGVARYIRSRRLNGSQR
jgi:hypothetical protein